MYSFIQLRELRQCRENEIDRASKQQQLGFEPHRLHCISDITVETDYSISLSVNIHESSCSNFSMAECFPEKSSWWWNEQVCQAVKRKAL